MALLNSPCGHWRSILVLWLVASSAINAMTIAPGDENVSRSLLWGDTHLHTAYSLDAFFRGNLTLTPEEAFRFAAGGAVRTDNGLEARLYQPIAVRFFGGWNYTEKDARHVDFRRAYSHGVPMGGVLPARDEHGGNPVFLITAMKDPRGANLQRLQIVKGWLDHNAQSQEKVYNVVSSKSGSASLTAHWRDPDFDPAQLAFYYVRVLEVPSPRWIVHDERRSGTPYPDSVDREHQERAYTSPIWYSPEPRLGQSSGSR